ncbi:MAG: thiolase [SAR202 cluster bacterium]|nr:thiolase [Chloroflexota bacterium]MQG88742.1 thiolase [SAR202 cluster bacterium]|tara:strand:+ start:1276 stop:2439 length:1164 start_codon:yes stop_codon:yes gene_type:complete
MPNIQRLKNISGQAHIIGVSESNKLGKVPEKSPLAHHAEAAVNAIDDSGLQLSDVDALFTAGWSTLDVAEYLGIQPRYTDSTSVGGSSFVIHVGHALAAIAAGYCEVALITHGQSGRSDRAPIQRNPGTPMAQYESPYGIIGPPISYAMAALRYMNDYGYDRTRQAMAEIAISTRKWANLNPMAYFYDTPASFDDYHNSKWVAWPFHLLDCCLVTDAGAAIVVTTAERARDAKYRSVPIIGAGEGHDHAGISQMPDLTRAFGKYTGPQALEMAGITHSDIDLAMIYDSFTYTVLVSLENLGFCGPGEAPDFVAAQITAPGGDFPLNTNGGGLSYTHPGMYGIFTVVEAVRQLRGQAGNRQLDKCDIAVAHGTGGLLSSTGTVIMGAG